MLAPATLPPAARVAALRDALAALESDAERIDRLGRQLARAFRKGHRLLAVGTGGGAALAEHLANELVGRPGNGRAPLPAMALVSGTAALTASLDECGPEEAFSRQVRAHGRPGDILVAFSNARPSTTVLAATQAALRMGLRTVGFTARLPDPLAGLCCDVVSADAGLSTTVEEVHQVAVHLLCAGIDAELAPSLAAGAPLPATATGVKSPRQRFGVVLPPAS